MIKIALPNGKSISLEKLALRVTPRTSKLLKFIRGQRSGKDIKLERIMGSVDPVLHQWFMKHMKPVKREHVRQIVKAHRVTRLPPKGSALVSTLAYMPKNVRMLAGTVRRMASEVRAHGIKAPRKSLGYYTPK